MENLSQTEQQWVAKLKEMGQGHLLEIPNATTEGLKRLLAQVEELDRSYPGGLSSYVVKARKLLRDSLEGVNPFEGCTPEIPTGEILEAGSEKFAEFEKIGMDEIEHVCFVLVAGGLGERLGYSDIKIGLPSETTTNTTYLELYVRTILACEEYVFQRTGRRVQLPLAIMTSDDTNAKTVAFLEKYDNFGLAKEQLTIMKQGKVPALMDNDATMAVSPSDPYRIETKPHGHGDVHILLSQYGLAKKWAAEGRKWMIFFQDTNGLVFHAMPAVLGVSRKLGLAMNSITVPRKPSEAVGGICRLRKDDGSSLTINVEYNLLGPLLLNTGDKKGDVADPKTGNSAYPGNINVLVFHVPRYSEVLEKSGGSVPEFVNPKYKDATKTTFKAVTRLECMMQEFPRLYEPNDVVGFTQLDRWLCFSTVKNNTADAAAKSKAGGSPEAPFTAEADQYFMNSNLLAIAAKAKGIAADIAEPRNMSFLDIDYKMGPRVVFYPSFALSLEHLKSRIHGGKIRISADSTLVVEGDVDIDGLDLEGTLVLKAAKGKKLRVKNLKIRNEGWKLEAIKNLDEAPLQLKIRGFDIKKTESSEVEA